MNANTTAAQIATANAGTYYPAAPGARTLADVRDLYINGERVSAVVAEDGSWNLFFGGRIVAKGQLNGTEGPLMTFFQAEALIVTDTETTEEAETVAVQQIREMGAELLVKAIALDVQAAKVAAQPSKAQIKNPRHPLNRAARIAQHAASARAEAEILAAWTAEDEKAYTAYVSEGLGATDGHYAPLTRTAWKATLGA